MFDWTEPRRAGGPALPADGLRAACGRLQGLIAEPRSDDSKIIGRRAPGAYMRICVRDASQTSDWAYPDNNWTHSVRGERGVDLAIKKQWCQRGVPRLIT